MKCLSFCVAVLTLSALPLSASVVPYSDPAGQGNQAWPGNLALDFNVNSPVLVTELGVFNTSGTGMINGSIQVVIYNTLNDSEVTPVVTFHGTYTPGALGFDVFQPIAPVTLPVGSYQVDAVGFSATDLDGNRNYGTTGPVLNDDGGRLTFTGAAWDGNTILDHPPSCPGCAFPQTQFDAGTFVIGSPTVVPEPAFAWVLAPGLCALVILARRRRALRA
jgi:hypothetical protein